MCETYRVFLSNLQGRMSGDRFLEGGRILAKLCLAGKSRASDCGDVEKILVAAPSEQSASATWVDKQFEAGCSSGDTNVCNRGFFRKWGVMNEELWPRLLRLVDASAIGCTAGAPLVCGEVAEYLTKFVGPQASPRAAEFYAAARKLPTRPGKEDISKAACKIEAQVRAAIAKGK